MAIQLSFVSNSIFSTINTAFALGRTCMSRNIRVVDSLSLYNNGYICCLPRGQSVVFDVRKSVCTSEKEPFSACTTREPTLAHSWETS